MPPTPLADKEEKKGGYLCTNIGKRLKEERKGPELASLPVVNAIASRKPLSQGIAMTLNMLHLRDQILRAKEPPCREGSERKVMMSRAEGMA